MKKLILTNYYVWFQGHKRSKYAHQFSHHWLHAFFQVWVTFCLMLVLVAAILEKLFTVKLIVHGKIPFLLIYWILPGVMLYLLLFNVYKVSKTDDDTAGQGIHISRKNKMLAWSIYLLMLPMIYLYFKLL